MVCAYIQDYGVFQKTTNLYSDLKIQASKKLRK